MTESLGCLKKKVTMKKFLLTLACVLVSLSGMAQESEDQLINGVWYLLNVTYKQGVPHYIASVNSNPNTDDDDTPLTKYTGNVVIPDTVEYSGNKYAVIGINRYAFYDCDGLTSVKLPDGIQRLAMAHSKVAPNSPASHFQHSWPRLETMLSTSLD